MATVTLSGVRKKYGQLEVIHGVDLQIADGEFVVLVGPSGCGKSTLLRMIAGLEAISAGAISIGDRVVNDLEPMARDIAMVFQNYALYPHMSVFDNMAYGLRNRRLARDEIEKRVQRAAEILQLGELLRRKPRQLSGGQRQRVAMGRAIVREPVVFLFDEPLSNLDAKLRVQMRLEIRKLHRELGVTSVYVTHDQVEAMTLADRLVVMNAGRAEQIGTPAELYERPATSYVGGFIGSPAMNFLSCRVADAPAALILPDGQQIALERGVFNGLGGRTISVGLRPEHLSIAHGAVGGGFRMAVDMIEELGADALVHGQIAGHAMTVRLAGRTAVRPGELLPMRIEEQHLHGFDPETGRRL
jgi:sn-glycerol 3-phosphate transport system ATP-binding protein